MDKSPTRQQIENCLQNWQTAFAMPNAQEICSVYCDEASLWGTFSPIRRASPSLIKNYFDAVFEKQQRQVKFLDYDIRLYVGAALCSGTYVFSWLEDNQIVELEARFSFVFIELNSKCSIVEHHSSRLENIEL